MFIITTAAASFQFYHDIFNFSDYPFNSII